MTDTVIDPVVLTDAAAEQILELVRAEGENFTGTLRIFVQGGGCSGFQYGFRFDQTQEDDDLLIEKNAAKILVDAISLQYLAGSTIDYKTSLSGSGFSIINPNATSTCGCGNSWSA